MQDFDTLRLSPQARSPSFNLESSKHSVLVQFEFFSAESQRSLRLGGYLAGTKHRRDAENAPVSAES